MTCSDCYLLFIPNLFPIRQSYKSYQKMDTQSAGTLQSPSTYSESSKSGSCKSGGSAKNAEDLTKDNGKVLCITNFE